MILYDCISDRYDPNPAEPYTLRDFLDMCRECFGAAPELHEDGDGNLHDDAGVVLAVSDWQFVSDSDAAHQ